MNIAITGGAGFIGSHVAKAVFAAGMCPVTVDSLIRGHREFVRWGPLVVADVRDRAAMRAVFETYRPVAAMHFAGRIDSAESLTEATLYHEENVGATEALLDTMAVCNVTRLVFSSSAAVYGNATGPVTEQSALAPVTPYGLSKLEAEGRIERCARERGLRALSLRYFNAAGADRDGEIGESHEPETHLIPRALRALATGIPMPVFGTDYATADGTAVRDFVHVEDLAHAHVAALQYLARVDGATAVNLGADRGYSVREVLATIESVVGRPVPTVVGGRRPGDVATLVADSRMARALLNWRPTVSDLGDIIRSAWSWYCRDTAPP